MRVRTAILAQERGVRCHSVIGLGRPIQIVVEMALCPLWVAGAHSAHTVTVCRAERRGGPVCGAPWPRSRSRSSMLLRRERPSRGRRLFGEISPQDRVQQRLVKQMMEVRKVSKEGPVKQIFEFPEPQMMEQLVDCQRSSSNSQCLLVKLGLLGPERTLVPRERVQQWTVEQIANWSREAWVQAGGQRSMFGQREFSMR